MSKRKIFKTLYINYSRANGLRITGATAARSTPDRKVICSNQVWFKQVMLDGFRIFCVGKIQSKGIELRIFSSIEEFIAFLRSYSHLHIRGARGVRVAALQGVQESSTGVV